LNIREPKVQIPVQVCGPENQAGKDGYLSSIRQTEQIHPQDTHMICMMLAQEEKNILRLEIPKEMEGKEMEMISATTNLFPESPNEREVKERR
jgi:hypothetical protein